MKEPVTVSIVRLQLQPADSGLLQLRLVFPGEIPYNIKEWAFLYNSHSLIDYIRQEVSP